MFKAAPFGTAFFILKEGTAMADAIRRAGIAMARHTQCLCVVPLLLALSHLLVLF